MTTEEITTRLKAGEALTLPTATLKEYTRHLASTEALKEVHWKKVDPLTWRVWHEPEAPFTPQEEGDQ